MRKRKVFFSVQVIYFLFALVPFLFSVADAAKTSEPDNAALAAVPAAVAGQLAQSGEADVLLVLDGAEANAVAEQMRKDLGVKNDNAAIIDEKARLYKQKKDKVLLRLTPADNTLKKDYYYFPIMFLRVNEHALVALLNMPEVSYVAENKVVQPYLTQSLPLIGATASEAWVYGTGAGTSVAVLDTGVDYTLSAFGSCSSPGVPASCKVAYESCFATGGCLSDKSHGTNVAGIVVGVAPEAKVLALDVFRTDGFAYYDDILDAFDWATANKETYNIVAVNMSLGGDRFTSQCPTDGLSVAISALKAAGIATAAASGNNGYTDAIGAPACVPDAISVGAVYDSDVGGLYYPSVPCTDSTTAADKVACFSNSASFLTMLAPGAIINAAGLQMAGTSQATPHVAGAVAVMKSFDNTLTVDEIVSVFTATGVSVQDSRNSITKPRLDLFAAVESTSPIISVAPSSVSFMSGQGGPNPANQTLNIANNGGGTLNWSVSESAAWLTLDPTSGTDTGNVTLSVDTTGLTEGTYTVNITITATGALNSPVTVPVTLEIKNAAYSEDFETGALTKLPWVTGGDALWTAQTSTVHTGSYAAKSGAITHSQKSYLQVTLNVTSPGYLYFRVKTSTETTWDKIKFYVDNVNEGPFYGWSGTTGWTLAQSEHQVSAGTHTFKWEYSKDGDTSAGSDTVWLDDIFFPPFNFPDISASPVSHDFGPVAVGASSSLQTFTVSNNGTGDLVIGTVTLSGANASDFVMQNDTCSEQTLIPSGACTVEAKFSPLSAGAKSANLSVPSNDAVTPTLNAALSGTGIPLYTLTVNKDGSTGFGTVTSAPLGIDCGPDCSEIYNENTPVTLTAAADANSTFSGWSGGGCSGTGACGVTMTGDQTVTAVFTILPPVADFSGSVLTGVAPLAVNFSDLSTNVPTAWAWNFGDSGTSSAQNPLHTFRTAGTYSVTLTVSNASGPDSEAKTAYITVNACGNQPVRISGVDLGTSIQTVYDNNAVEADVIKTQAVEFIEELTLGRPIQITLSGGHNCAYTANPSDTAIHGSLTISAGTVTVENIVIQ